MTGDLAISPVYAPFCCLSELALICLHGVHISSGVRCFLLALEPSTLLEVDFIRSVKTHHLCFLWPFIYHAEVDSLYGPAHLTPTPASWRLGHRAYTRAANRDVVQTLTRDQYFIVSCRVVDTPWILHGRLLSLGIVVYERFTSAPTLRVPISSFRGISCYALMAQSEEASQQSNSIG